MGEIGNVEEMQTLYHLKEIILKEFKDDITEEEFVLSMGTSQDYQKAITEGGSNQIRLGTTIFGARDFSD